MKWFDTTIKVLDSMACRVKSGVFFLINLSILIITTIIRPGMAGMYVRILTLVNISCQTVQGLKLRPIQAHLRLNFSCLRLKSLDRSQISDQFVASRSATY